ncbi:hypothetical protein EC957_011221 [Mortierella hygrophila]|uniref:Aminotransferase class I/classII domain-containing protein n=1 Tax=Mortierella hygrophila TaxID=979708 RepID=A0A9P6K3W9_9FUNG|nr:hypothetical protein EC957_011221 [Mortierella hygrophila]
MPASPGSSLSNPIRTIVDHIKAKPNANNSMISLANFKTHRTWTDAVCEQLHSCMSSGDKFTHPEAPLVSQDVILTSGCPSALDICIGVLCNGGEDIVLLRPAFSLDQQRG